MVFVGILEMSRNLWGLQTIFVGLSWRATHLAFVMLAFFNYMNMKNLETFQSCLLLSSNFPAKMAAWPWGVKGGRVIYFLWFLEAMSKCQAMYSAPMTNEAPPSWEVGSQLRNTAKFSKKPLSLILCVCFPGHLNCNFPNSISERLPSLPVNIHYNFPLIFFQLPLNPIKNPFPRGFTPHCHSL